MSANRNAVLSGARLAVVILFFAVQASAQVARVFLSGTGNDANDCSNAATPCRSLQGAITQCPAKGEIIVLTSGGFGTANITKSLTINAPDGVVAFNARTITVNTIFNDAVVIRGLSMQGAVFGDSDGIAFTGGGTLIVENSIIDGFVTAIDQTGSNSSLVVNNCELRNGSGNAVATTAPTGTSYVTLQDSRFVNSHWALVFFGPINAVIKHSVISNSEIGILVSGSSNGDPRVTVDTCVIAHNTSSTTSSSYGIKAQDFFVQPYDTTVRVTNSEIYGNLTGLNAANASIVSYGTNCLWDNGTDGAFTSTVPQQ